MSRRRESGFIMMVLVVIMVLGAGAYFGGYYENFSYKYRSKATMESFEEVNNIKQQLLRYAIFQPELYQSDLVANTVTNKQTDEVPGPGYLPCVDLDGDGSVLNNETSCGNPRNSLDDATGFVYGFLPVGFTTRNIFFGALEPKYYYYVVDERFVNGNNAYNNGRTGRYAPLNSIMTPASAPDASPGNALPDNTLPWLTLNGVSGYVALIIDPGVPQVALDGTIQDRTQAGDAIARIGDYLDKRFDANLVELDGNADGNRFFFSQGKENIGVNDTIVGITFAEWREAVERRVCSQSATLLGLSVNAPFWFNDYDAGNNPAGSNWRGLVGGCP